MDGGGGIGWMVGEGLGGMVGWEGTGQGLYKEVPIFLFGVGGGEAVIVSRRPS